MVLEQKPWLKIEELGEIAQSYGNLSTNVRDLEGDLISPRDEAYARLHSDIGATNGTRVSLLVYYLKGELPVLRKGKGIITPDLANSIVAANARGKYYSTDAAKQYNYVRKIADGQEKERLSPEKRDAMVLPSRNAFKMFLKKNLEHLSYVFEDAAQAYLQKSKEVITFYPIYAEEVDGNKPNLLTAPGGTIINYVWFGGVDSRALLGDYRVAGNYGRARRVFPQKD